LQIRDQNHLVSYSPFQTRDDVGLSFPAPEIYSLLMPGNSTYATSLEMQLVIAMSRIPADARALAAAEQCVREGVDWKVVADQSVRWQVEPVVLGNLLRHFAGSIPPQLRAVFAQREQLSRAAAVTQTLRVLDATNGLNAAGVAALVLKGPAIARLAYDDVSQRTFSDIDLIVRRNDLTAAQHYLESRGYKPLFSPESRKNLIDGQHALEFSGPGPHIELHWALLPRYFRFDLEPTDLWEQAITIQIGPGAVQTLAPHHLFLYLCAHGAKHEWTVYRWVCDIAQLGRRLTPEQSALVATLAERTGSKRIVALALRLVRDVFGDDPAPSLTAAFALEPTDVLAAVARSRFGLTTSSPALLPPSLARIHPYAEPLAFWIRSRERLGDRFVCGSRFVFTAAPDDKPSSGYSRLLRPVRLAVNAVRRATRRG
jgi:hypothetical protein